jgi:hypothetical protein
MLRAELSDLVMAVFIVSRSRKGLHDGGVNATLVHAADHVFLGAVEAEDAALAKMGVGVNYFGHCDGSLSVELISLLQARDRSCQ